MIPLFGYGILAFPFTLGACGMALIRRKGWQGVCLGLWLGAEVLVLSSLLGAWIPAPRLPTGSPPGGAFGTALSLILRFLTPAPVSWFLLSVWCLPLVALLLGRKRAGTFRWFTLTAFLTAFTVLAGGATPPTELQRFVNDLAMTLQGWLPQGWPISLKFWGFAAATLAGLGFAFGESGQWRARRKRFFETEKDLSKPFLRRWEGIDGMLLALILLTALFFRVHRITELPPGCYYDEGARGSETYYAFTRILTSPQPLAEFGEYTRKNFFSNPYLYWVTEGLASVSLGKDPVSIRLPSVLFGLLGVLLTFLLTRLIFGRTPAFWAAGFLAVSHWHVTFSRISFGGIQAPFFIALSAFCYWKLYLRITSHGFQVTDGNTLGWACGLTLSLLFGFPSYNTMRIMPGIFLASLGHLFFARGWYRSGQFWVGVGMATVLGSGAAFYFQGEKILSRTEVFRNSELFICATTNTAGDCLERLWWNVQYYAEMFHFRGDGNARHNLPWAPELEYTIGIWFFLGLIGTVWRWRDPRYFFLLAWLGIMIQPALWSIEAPHSLRTLGIAPAVLIMAGTGLRDWARMVRRSFGSWTLLPLGALGLLYSGHLFREGYEMYFFRVEGSQERYEKFDTAKANAARFANKAATTFNGKDKILMEATFHGGSPGLGYLLQPNVNVSTLLPLQHIPWKEAPTTPVLYLFRPDQQAMEDQLRFFYPGATFQQHMSPFGNLEFRTAMVPVAELEAVQGLELSVIPGRVQAGAALEPGTGTSLGAFGDFSFDWATVQGLPPPPFTAVWRGAYYSRETGTNAFALLTGEPSALFIDGEPIVDQPGNNGTPAVGTVELGQGFHDIALWAIEQDGKGSAKFIGNFGKRPEEILASPILCSKPLPFNDLRGLRFARRPLTLRLLREIPIPPNSEMDQGDQIRDVVVLKDGRFLVVEGNTVLLLAPDGRLLREIGGYGKEETQLRTPGGIAPGLDESFYVNDSWNVYLKRFKLDGSLKWSRSLSLWGGMGVTLDEDRQELWIADSGRHRVVRAALDGRVLEAFGQEGTGPGQFRMPNDVAVLADGNVLVNDVGTGTIGKFSRKGRELLRWHQDGLNEFAYLAITPEGTLFATAPIAGKVTAFTNGGLQVPLRLEGAEPGKFPWKQPRGIFFQKPDTLAVSDGELRQILLFLVEPLQ